MPSSDDIARVFAVGLELARSSRYFRFSVLRGMEDLGLDEWNETEKMKALTTDYLSLVRNGHEIESCAWSLLYPDENRLSEAS